MSIVTTAEVRALVGSSLTDAQLQEIIDREEAELVSRFGANYDDAPITEEQPSDGKSVFLRRPIESVETVTEYTSLGSDGEVLATTTYHAWKAQGRLQRLPEGTRWGALVEVAYTPVDDTAKRKSVIIELVRLTVEQTALKSESVAGEYSYTAPDNWQAQRASVYRRLGFMEI
jgi:hypothetical protein